MLETMARDPTLPIRAGYAVASVPSTDLGNSLARTQRELGSGHDGCARTNAGPLCVASPVRTSSSGRLSAPRALSEDRVAQSRGATGLRSLGVAGLPELVGVALGVARLRGGAAAAAYPLAAAIVCN